MRMLIALAFVLVLLAPSGSEPAASAVGTQSVPAQGLDGGCYALRSPYNARFVTRNALGGYQATATSAGAAELFRLQGVAQTDGRYLLYGRTGDYVAAALGNLTVAPTRTAGPAADWLVGTSAGADTVTLTATAAGKQLAVVPLIGALVLQSTPGAAGRFQLVPATGCADAPESQVNAVGEPLRGTTPTGEVRGFVDTHSHLTMFEGLGGRVHCGKPWDRYGVTAALVDCPDHEPAGLGGWFENLVSTGSPIGTHDTTGWPTFRDWPRHDSLTHETTYYKWLERAWRGGLRIYVNHLVSNRVLCEIYPLKRTPCDEMESIRIQAQRMYELQDYIDAQHGGPQRGWLRVVTDPEQARDVIADGKLAIVLGVEISELFGCRSVDGAPQCTRDDIDRGVDEIHALGVRDTFVCHKYDNALCGVRFDGGVQGAVVNAGNFASTGRFWQVEPCTGPAHDNTVEVSIDALYGPLRALLPPGVTFPVYPAAPHCNVNGLTELGAYAMQRLMAKRMIIELDHMSVKATGAALDLLEASGYAGAVSSHGWLDPLYHARLSAVGGFVSSYGLGSEQFVQEWRRTKAVADPRYAFGFGLGTDANGLGALAPPRAGNAANPVRYPFTSFDGGVTLDRLRTGQRTWDVNTDGVANIGLIPDFVEDLRQVAGQEIVDDMARGAEAYLQMWERALGTG